MEEKRRRKTAAPISEILDYVAVVGALLLDSLPKANNEEWTGKGYF